MRLFSSVCATFCNALSVLATTMSVVSSVNVYTCDSGTVLMVSLMYIRNKVVESVLCVWFVVGFRNMRR